MARKPKAQLHPDVAAALPMALAAMDDAQAPARRGRKAQADPAPAKAPRRPKHPAAAAAVAAPEGHAPRRGPKRRASQPDGAPEQVETDAPAHEATQPAGDDTQPPLPSLDAPPPAQPAAHWDRATDTVRFDWPAIERTAAASGPNQRMAKLLVAARAEGANSRWPL